MEIHCHCEQGVTRLRVHGRFDICATDAKARLLALCAAPMVELDLGEVEAIDTLGIRLLLLLYRHARAEGRSLRLVACSPAVSHLIELYGLGRAFGLAGLGGFSANLPMPGRLWEAALRT